MPLQHFHSAPHNGVCPRSPYYRRESLDVSCSALLISWRDCLPVAPGALDTLVSEESPSLPFRPRPVACLSGRTLVSYTLRSAFSHT